MNWRSVWWLDMLYTPMFWYLLDVVYIYWIDSVHSLV